MAYNQYGQYMPGMPYGYNPYQQPQYQPTPPNQQQATPQPMSPPMRTVDLIQIKSVDDVTNYPVNAGTIQLFQMMDDSAFVTKAVYADGQSSIDIYPKQPKKPAAPPLDPSLYVTKEELDKRLESLTRFRRMEESPSHTPTTAADA